GDGGSARSVGVLPARDGASGPHPVRTHPSAVRGHPPIPRRQRAHRPAADHPFPHRARAPLSAPALHLFLPLASSFRVLRGAAACEDPRRLARLVPTVPCRCRVDSGWSLPPSSP